MIDLLYFIVYGEPFLIRAHYCRCEKVSKNCDRNGRSGSSEISLSWLELNFNRQAVKKICLNDPGAAKKLKECEKATLKLKFEEAIAIPESERLSIVDSIDYPVIGLVAEDVFIGKPQLWGLLIALCWRCVFSFYSFSSSLPF
ncbi:serine threonine- phosphatase 5 isoform X1 [Olea europaea subsp. europaea]|uniref:Serine threonine- phosphatase 5 isoform X1 n=1 Tax=Olea europaea subsp. europaea TaxID=158383 RepID=A0A8S0Q7X3_OLEEU|nr:serine threonine- phosphatase 5 isoform X1 [Olea europaea subsp. europaea]